MKAVLVLGGGGAKAIAHVGAWEALRERSLEVVHIVGTSMGAVIGAALAAGSSAEQLMHLAESLQRKDVAAVDLFALVKGMFATSILKVGALRRTIARFVPQQAFAELPIALTVTATDFASGELVLFGAAGQDAPLQEVLCASCALPLYFPAVTIAGRSFVDGGIRAVLPLSVAAALSADIVVAVDVGPGFDEAVPSASVSAGLNPPLIRAHGEAIRIMMAAQTEQAIKAWPQTAAPLVVVRAVAEREATFALGQAERYFRAGHDAAQQALTSVSSRLY